jgi:hypothetical protein
MKHPTDFPRLVWWFAFLVIALKAIGRGEAASTEPASAVLRGEILDGDTGQATACTVAITDAQGKLVLERESFRAGFRCDGHFEKRLPAGRTSVVVSRGLETSAIRRTLELPVGEVVDLKLTLQRTVDLRRLGWYAGDSHAHMIHGEKTIPVDFDFVALTAQAEDLQYFSLSHTWQLDHPTPERLEAQLQPRSTSACLLTWNLEAPKNYYQGDAGRCLGHCWTLGMRGRTPEGQDVIPILLEASAWDYESAKPTFGNFESHDLIHAQGGTLYYTHPARWWMGAWGGQGGYPKQERMRISNMAVELPLDTLLGPTFDGLDVLTGDGEYQANTLAFELWALLLNHGYRVAATASSDACFDRPGGAVPGTARTYTYCSDGFSWAATSRNTARGQTFATTGPLLVVSVDRQPPGSAFSADGKPRDLSLAAWASGKDPKGLTRIEVLKNGGPFQAWILPATQSFQTNLALNTTESAWFCVRAIGGDPQRQRAISGAFFFDATPFVPPQPVHSRIHARIRDANSSKLLAGRLTEITCCGTLPRPGQIHEMSNGEDTLAIPGTVRLRAETPGYSPVMRSPVWDNPALVKYMTSLESTNLVKWETFEKIRTLLENVELDFPMMPR